MNHVIYVYGKDQPTINFVWQNAHPRGPRANTTLTLFDYASGKRQKWLSWNGRLPPETTPASVDSIASILDLYDFIKALPAKSLVELHFFCHGWEGGPVLANTFESPPYNSSNQRDPTDVDPRIKDFSIDTVVGGSEGAKFAQAFSPSALVKLWGCTHQEPTRQLIKRTYFSASSNVERELVKRQYQDFIRDGTYQYALHKAIKVPVYAAPLGWGTNPYLPFGIEGKATEKAKPKRHDRFPPHKNDEWWRVSQYFRPDRGHDFYSKVLKAKLDVLDYVAYEDAIVSKN